MRETPLAGEKFANSEGSFQSRVPLSHTVPMVRYEKKTRPPFPKEYGPRIEGIHFKFLTLLHMAAAGGRIAPNC